MIKPAVMTSSQTNPAKSSKTGAGAVDETIEFGGVKFAPGNWIYCDENGVLLAPHALDG